MVKQGVIPDDRAILGSRERGTTGHSELQRMRQVAESATIDLR